MPLVKKTYRQIADDTLASIVGGEATEEHVYQSDKPTYRLANTPVRGILDVQGISRGTSRIFARDVDYALAGDSVDWLGRGERPDEDTSFSVRYLFSRPSGLSDLNPGSVLRTVVEAVSREIEYLYLQLDEAYSSGFLDTASGEALDLLVSLLGLRRKPPQPSTGYVTFGRSSEPESIAVSGEVHLYDSSAEFDLRNALVKEVVKVEGTVDGRAVTFQRDSDYAVAGRRIRWLPGGLKPDNRTVFRVTYAAYQEVVIPKGTRVSTFSARPEEARVFVTSQEAYLQLTSEGRWEAEVPIVCTLPGRRGNVLAGMVSLMPRPVMGAEYVVNKGDLTNGVEAEGDPELRERAKHALEFAAKATTPSLESAVRAVEGVSSLLIEDMPDGVSGVVKVIADGGDTDRILRVIDETRAAGIRVEFRRPKIVYIDVTLTLVLLKDAMATQIGGAVESLVRGYISSLGIGEDVLYSRIVESVLSVKGVWDAADVTITAHREGVEALEAKRENVQIRSEERANPRTINLLYRTRE